MLSLNPLPPLARTPFLFSPFSTRILHAPFSHFLMSNLSWKHCGLGFWSRPFHRIIPVKPAILCLAKSNNFFSVFILLNLSACCHDWSFCDGFLCGFPEHPAPLVFLLRTGCVFSILFAGSLSSDLKKLGLKPWNIPLHLYTSPLGALI